MIYSLLQECIHKPEIKSLSMTVSYYFLVGHFVSVVYSLLVTKDELL
jgi:hypothetical protein